MIVSPCRKLWYPKLKSNFYIYLHAKNQLYLMATSIINNSAKLWKLWRLSACKKWSPFLTSFLRYCKDIANLLFWKLWECLTIPIKIMVLICSKLSCLSACKKSTSSLTSFLWYCRKIANLLYRVIWACLLWPGMKT